MAHKVHAPQDMKVSIKKYIIICEMVENWAIIKQIETFKTYTTNLSDNARIR